MAGALLSSLEEENTMPKGKHLQGVGAKEQRQYEHIKESAEVAALTVMKHHKEAGHKTGK